MQTMLRMKLWAAHVRVGHLQTRGQGRRIYAAGEAGTHIQSPCLNVCRGFGGLVERVKGKLGSSKCCVGRPRWERSVGEVEVEWWREREGRDWRATVRERRQEEWTSLRFS